jgi:tetratricopeptide (TPR) repeat protein
MKNGIYILIPILIQFNKIVADDDGLINYRNKNYTESKAYYENLIANTEENPAAVLGLGATQYQLGDIPGAARSFEEALKSDDNNIQERAFYNLGNSIYSQQRPDESVAFYRKALELNPNDDDAKFNYELAKYFSNQQQNQDQQQQDHNQQSNNQNNQNNPDNQPQDAENKEPDKQEDQESETSENEQRDAPKSQQQINAEAILDALKDEEKIHQKVKMAQQTGRKNEKDW